LRLAALFWPERPETLARRALSNTLWQIRSSLGEAAERLTTDGEDIIFHLDADDWWDVAEFEELLESSSELPLASRIMDLQAALGLYQGDLLTSLYEDWCLLERERLRERYLRALEQLLMLLKRQGAYDEALIVASRLVTADPLRESAHRELMRLYHLLGRPRAALLQFERLRALLTEELGVNPTPMSMTLYREIAAHLEESAAPYLPVEVQPPLLGDLSHLPLVGRQEERSRLLHALKAALQSHGGLAVVRGAAGVGKTRLVHELIADAEWRGFQVGLAKIAPLGAVPPYQLLREALSSLLTPLRISQMVGMVEDRWLSALVPLFPFIQEQLPDLPHLPPLDLHAEWRRLWEALAHCLQALASITPLLLVLEDVHWADNASLAALPHLAGHLADVPLLLVLTSRVVEAHERPLVLEILETAGRNAPLTRIDLLPFAPTELTALLQRALAMELHDTASSPFIEQLVASTGGNVLHLLESLKLMMEQGTLIQEAGGHWIFPEVTTSLHVPTSVRGLIEERVARLPAAAKEALDLVAVLGEDADFDVLLAGKMVSAEDLPRHLERLRQRGFLRQTETHYRFAHDLVRMGVYDTLTIRHRRELHQRAGEAIESVDRTRIESLAYHFTRSEQWDRAVKYNKEAGDEARAVYANDEAVAHYTQAMEALEQLPRAPNLDLCFDLHLACETVYALCGAREAQAKELMILADLATTLGDAQQRGEVLLRQAHYREATGNYQGVVEVAKEAAAMGISQNLVKLETESRLLWGLGLRRQGKYEAAQSQFEDALELARSAQLETLEANILRSLGVLLAYRGHYHEAQEHLSTALRLYRDTDDRRGEAETLNNLGGVADYLEDFASAQAWYRDSLHVCQEIGYRRGEGDALNNLGVLADGVGDYQAARDYYEQCLRIYREINYRQGEAWVLGNLGYLFDVCGDYEEARAHYEAALATAREVGDRQSEAASLADMALFLHHS
ncbi:MAG: ATP-binding protein, partial [Anaerolineae bacterium]